jgi:hypothetical protein
MRENNHQTTPVLDGHDSQPPATAADTSTEPVYARVIPATIGLGAGAGIVAAAVAFGAAEVAVGVGAAYLIYTTLSGGAAELSAAVRTVLHALAFAGKPRGGTDDRANEIH